MLYDLHVNANISMKAAIFDGDDTLWRTEILYDRAREAARSIVSRCGVDPVQWELRQRAIDVENVVVFGFNSARFPTSCVQAFRELRRTSDSSTWDKVEDEIFYAAKSVFRATPELMPHARGVLEALRLRDVHLALVTKGDPDIQADRVEKSGLSGYFEIAEIVPDKTTAIIRRVLGKLNVDPSNAWVIGNSLRSDILPALPLGVRGIWIDAPVWEYERIERTPPLINVSQVKDLLDVLKIVP